VQDAAIVLAAIQGPDGEDATVHDFPFAASGDVDVRGWKVGYVKAAFDGSTASAQVLDELKALGVELVPIELPASIPAGDLLVILSAEAATAFDELTRDGDDDKMVWQEEQAWPNTFRAARLIPAIEYLRASRLRTLLMKKVDEVMKTVDCIVSPGRGDSSLVITNLTGHPCIVAPSGFRKNGTPRSITFVGQLFGETELSALAGAWQRSTDYHRKHPTL
jgi:Asp-tRNA(Asn)/Glu-tRNA(Gln) amidotransferase A subunit family amidase